jgi:hypothetical protein
VLGLLDAHAAFLAALTEAAERWQPGSTVLPLFEQLCDAGWPRFTGYLDTLNGALATIEALVGSSRPFRAFVSQCRVQPECKQQSLHELFIRPVGRWDVYAAFLEELAPTVAAGHPDGQLLPRCRSRVWRLAAQTTARVRLPQQQQHGQTVLGQIEGVPTAFSARMPVFIVALQLRQVVLKTARGQFGQPDLTEVRHVQEVSVVLFDCAVLLCSRREHAQHYGQQRSVANTYLATLPLHELSLRAMDEVRSHHLISLRCEGEHPDRFLLEADGR